MAYASPSSPIDSTLPPPQLPASAAAPPSSSKRRLPPPCWSHDETMALIDSYRDKWYSLRRGNLKATHWQEVADAVADRCPNASPPKTAVQCRHKMEKLRKRYRTELQRSRSMPVSRFTSNWVHFNRMDSMEKGPSADLPLNSDSPYDDDLDNDPDQDLSEDAFNNGVSNTRSLHKWYPNGIGSASVGGGSGGFRIRIPTGVSIAHPGPRKIDHKFNPNAGPNPHYNSSPNFGVRVLRDCKPASGKLDHVTDMVNAVKVLGDGFVKMERMKMEMVAEIETMRMDMEMKRTEMLLESQQRIVESFAMAVSSKRKKAKRMMASPE